MKKIYLLLAVCLLFVLGEAHAQADQVNNVPQLNGHLFTVLNDKQGPFIKSSFGNKITVAYTQDFEKVLKDQDGDEIIGLTGSLLFAGLSFDYQQKVKDWAALYLNATLTARVATELQSMLSQGVSSIQAYRIGWLFRIAESKKLMLSTNFEVNNSEATFINVGQFLKEVLVDSIPSSITKEVPTLNGLAGLRLAYGQNEIIGYQLRAEGGFGESYERGATEFFYDLFAALDIQLATKTKVPLGFLLFYNQSSLPDYVYVDNKSAFTGGLKIAYTGAPHLNLGLEVMTTNLPLPNVTERVQTTGVAVTMRYFFN